MLNEDWLEDDGDGGEGGGASSSSEPERSGVEAHVMTEQTTLASREQGRQLYDAGYREGADEARQNHLQTGFDEGFVMGMNQGKEVGMLYGVIR